MSDGENGNGKMLEGTCPIGQRTPIAGCAGEAAMREIALRMQRERGIDIARQRELREQIRKRDDAIVNQISENAMVLSDLSGLRSDVNACAKLLVELKEQITLLLERK